MTPQLALDLSVDGISLLSRAPDGTWWREGSVRLDDPAFTASVARLRARGVARVGEEFCSYLVIPDSQLLFTTLERDDRRPEVTIRHNLEGRTPYGVDDLAFDYVETGDRLEVAVVALETLLEAESFAVEHGFRPVGFTANPSDGHYREAPWFGTTGLADSFLKGDRVTKPSGLFEVHAAPPLPGSSTLFGATPPVDATEAEAPQSAAPIDEAALDTPPADEAPLEEAAVAEAPVEEAPVEDPPVHEASPGEATEGEASIVGEPVDAAPDRTEDATPPDETDQEAPVSEPPAAQSQDTPSPQGDPSDIAHVAALLANARPAEAPPAPSKPQRRPIEIIRDADQGPGATAASEPDAASEGPSTPARAAPEVADLAAGDAQPDDAEAPDPLREAGSPDEAPAAPEPSLPAAAPAAPVATRGRTGKSAPSFATRRRGEIAAMAGVARLERIAPRLTSVIRATRDRFDAALPDAPAPDAPAAETPAADAASLVGAQDTPPETTAEAGLAPETTAEAGLPSETPQAAGLPEGRLAPAALAGLPSGSDARPQSPRRLTTLAPAAPDDDDAFDLEPAFTQKASHLRRTGLYATGALLVAMLGIGGWAALTRGGDDGPGQVAAVSSDTTTAGTPPAADLAALLPNRGADRATTTTIVAPDPVVLPRRADAPTAEPDAVAGRTLLDTPQAGRAPQTDASVDATALAAVDPGVISDPAPGLARPDTPSAETATRDDPALPRPAEDVADAQTPGTPGTETAGTQVAGSDDPIADTSETAPAIVSLLADDATAEAERQAAALAALLEAPDADLTALNTDPAPAGANASEGGTAQDVEGAVSVALANATGGTAPSKDASEGEDLVAASTEGTLAPGGYRVVAGRPDIDVLPTPRPGPEGVTQVAVTSAVDEADDAAQTGAVDADEAARRALLSRVRPVIRPRTQEGPGTTETEAEAQADADGAPETEASAAETAALAALGATRPQPRPAGRVAPEPEPEPEAAAPEAEVEDPAVIAAEQAASASLAAARTAAAATARAEAEAAAISRLALPRSARPDTRPRAVEQTAARIVQRRREAAATPAAAPSAPRATQSASTPTIRSAGGSVARAATQQNQIRLNRVSLIGTYGRSNARRALVRMGNGRYVKVEVGDRLDRGRVIAIGDGVVRYQRGGRNLELRLPS